MTTEKDPSINFAEELLLCHMVLNDDIAPRLSEFAGPAFWRGFILENRTTKHVSLRFRYLYRRADGDERCWYVVEPSEQMGRDATAAKLRCDMENVLQLGMSLVGIPRAEIANAIECHYPPDDGGDGMKMIDWLVSKDLMEIKTIKLDEAESD